MCSSAALAMWYGAPVESTVEPDTEETLTMHPLRWRSASKQPRLRWKADAWLVSCSAAYSASVSVKDTGDVEDIGRVKERTLTHARAQRTQRRGGDDHTLHGRWAGVWVGALQCGYIR